VDVNEPKGSTVEHGGIVHTNVHTGAMDPDGREGCDVDAILSELVSDGCGAVGSTAADDTVDDTPPASASAAEMGAVLLQAAADNDADSVEHLLTAGIDPDAISPSPGSAAGEMAATTALLCAVQCANIGIVRQLLAGGATVQLSAHRQRSPLMVAATVGDNDILLLLLGKMSPHDNAHINSVDEAGWTAVHCGAPQAGGQGFFLTPLETSRDPLTESLCKTFWGIAMKTVCGPPSHSNPAEPRCIVPATTATAAAWHHYVKLAPT
jgi:hypothetical protein